MQTEEVLLSSRGLFYTGTALFVARRRREAEEEGVPAKALGFPPSCFPSILDSDGGSSVV